jgi:GTPase SAR1 family protein
MALFNYATKEITIKIVYYGPGLSGKTTNLQFLHSAFDPAKRGKLLSLATEADRTLFFDFLPVELGKISEFSIRFQLYTVPGQVRYNATRKLVLKGADAVVFVGDSQREMRQQNVESLRNMRENLIANNIDPGDIPVILQYNKRDLTNILSVDELNADLNEGGKYEFKESVATKGAGVQETFQRITKLVIEGISKKHKDLKIRRTEEAAAPFQEATYSEEVPPSASPAYESSGMTIERNVYERQEARGEPVRPVATEEASSPKEILIKQVKEVPVIPKEKLEMFLNSMTEIAQTLKEIRNVISSVHYEVKDLKKDQKEINSALREIRNTFAGIKTRRSWFRLS